MTIILDMRAYCRESSITYLSILIVKTYCGLTFFCYYSTVTYINKNIFKCEACVKEKRRKEKELRID